jgi:uncharacterized repeat protein (TIGR03803 family)
MNKPITVGMAKGKALCLVISLILASLGWRGFDACGQTVTNLYQFGGNPPDNPIGVLVQGSDGSFYGTTFYGGPNNYGTVFQITSQGTLTTLWQFSGSNGSTPDAGLVRGSDGNFYGTTMIGGPNYIVSGGDGTVFQITSQGTLTTLWQFNGTNGAQPRAGLVRGDDGNFYGTTFYGGTNNDGTVFKITPQGTLTTLWQFNGSNGENPEAGLVQITDGNFYGTTAYGGTNSGVVSFGYTNSLGTVFKITPQGTLTTLWQFNGANGAAPTAGLVQGSDGNFYGTTEAGGLTNLNNGIGNGTVFKITAQGTLTTLWKFNGANGTEPTAGLVQGSDGNFYGTTLHGGTNALGTVFQITSQGTLTTLWQFNGSNGYAPYASLVQSSDGRFYGTTEAGGANGGGTVFRLSMPLNPSANQISSIQVDSSGANLVFSIPSVAYETYQLQFSPSMNPTNWSNISGAFVSNSIGALLTLTNFGGAFAPQGFYRFDITP